MAGSAFEDARTIELLKPFTPVLVADTDSVGMAAHATQGFPTVIFVSSDGKELGRTVGAVPVSEFRAAVESAASKL